MGTEKEKAKDKGQKSKESARVFEKDIQVDEDLLDEDDKDFGGLNAPEDFKRQMGCGG